MTDKVTHDQVGIGESHPLDVAAWASLTGHHAHFAETLGQAIRYAPEISVFATLSPDADDRAWVDLAKLVGPRGEVALANTRLLPPSRWEVVRQGTAVQMIDVNVEPVPDPEAITLGEHDVPEMLDLVERTRPGPFRARTVELGTYLGIRRDGKLVAMAGERLHPPGWTEISAVCTDENYRGQGLATRLVSAVVANIRTSGETAFLHANTLNTNAIRLYESLGFEVRRETTFMSVAAP